MIAFPLILLQVFALGMADDGANCGPSLSALKPVPPEALKQACKQSQTCRLQADKEYADWAFQLASDGESFLLPDERVCDATGFATTEQLAMPDAERGAPGRCGESNGALGAHRC